MRGHTFLLESFLRAFTTAQCVMHRGALRKAESTEVRLFLCTGQFVFRTLPLSVSWPKSHARDEIRH